MEDVLFDLKDLRCIVYDKVHPKWGDSLTRNVARNMRSVLREVDEHGPLFPEIETDTEYSEIEAKPSDSAGSAQGKSDKTQDMTGVWNLTQKWEITEDSNTILSLQQRDSSLSGFAVTSPSETTPENEWRVSQEMSGFVRGNQFELVATSYQILESKGRLSGWALESFRGTIESVDFVQGEMLDEEGEEGRFWGERASKNPMDRNPFEEPTDE